MDQTPGVVRGISLGQRPIGHRPGICIEGNLENVNASCRGFLGLGRDARSSVMARDWVGSYVQLVRLYAALAPYMFQ